jgi:hypothetical protein
MLYLRKEKPTRETDSTLFDNTDENTRKRMKQYDVIAYSDEECISRIAIWPWYYSNKPRKNCKKVMLNCSYRWDIKWLEDKV